jgi:O-antigen/teichoic acid export membrane protein
MSKDVGDLFKKSGVVFTGKIFEAISMLIFNIIAGRYLGATIYGEFIYVFTFISIFSTISKLGLEQGLLAFLPKLKVDDRNNEYRSLISFSILLVTIISIILSLIVFLQSDNIAKYLLNDIKYTSIIRVVSPLIIFVAINQLSIGIFRSAGEIKVFILAQNFIAPLIKLILILGMIIIGLKSQTLNMVFIYYGSFGGSVIYIMANVYKHKYYSKVSNKYNKIYKETLLFSLPLLFSSMLIFIIGKTDSYMIGYFLPDDRVGIYNMAYQVSMMSSFVLAAFNIIFAPMISVYYHKKDFESLKSTYQTVTKWVVVVNMFAFSLILLLSSEIMNVFGSEFKIGYMALILCASGQAINAGVGPAGYMNIMTGHPKSEFYVSFIVIFMNIFLNYTLIPIWGINGAAFASLVSVTFSNSIRFILMHRNLKIHPFNKGYFFVFLSAIGCTLLFGIMKYFISFNYIMNIVIYFSLFSIVFFSINLKFNISEEDEIIVSGIKKKLKLK